jgi:hypothetical protein
VELHNRGLFGAGMVVSGSLAYASWLNEYGAAAPAIKPLDHLELSRREPLRLPTASSFASILQATQLSIAEIPPASRNKPPTSVSVGGGLTVKLLAPGAIAGEALAVPELDWHAQTVPFYGYLLEAGRSAVILAGGHCVPAMLPEASRIIWHSLYLSTRRGKDAAAAEADLTTGATLAAILIEQGGLVLRESYRAAPRELRNAAHSRLPRLEGLLAEHVQARDEFRKLR